MESDTPAHRSTTVSPRLIAVKDQGSRQTGDGTRGGTRTPDAHLRTVALYPLSYAGQYEGKIP